MTTALPAVALPPPSPALVLHEAAARLRGWAAAARVEMAINPYWVGGFRNGIGGAISGDAGVLASLLSPDAADELADWLDATAVEAVRLAATGLGAQTDVIGPYPTTIARRILEAT